MSRIEWTEQTWNPIVGCSVVSPGCTNCYAMKMANRLAANPATPHYAGTVKPSRGGPVWTGKVALASEDVLTAPLRRRKPTTYFVNSMGDLFHENVPDDWIDRVWSVMVRSPQHRFQVLTKRPARMRDYVQGLDRAAREAGNQFPPANVWLGVSAEDQARADQRIPDLLETHAAVRFVSAEPLLGPVDFGGALAKIDWVIVGGESGPDARPMHPQWARDIRDQCQAAGTGFFFKQWGNWLHQSQSVARTYGVIAADEEFDWEDADNRGLIHIWHDEGASIRLRKTDAGRLLDGREWNEVPE